MGEGGGGDVVSSILDQGEVYKYVIKFVSDLRQVGGFLWVLHHLNCHDIMVILLKVALNTINHT